MYGKPTPPETVARFRAEYLRLGNASEAARLVGLPTRTGRELAQAANEDEDFAAERRALYASALDEVGAKMLEGVRTAFRRISDEPLTPEEHALLMARHKLKSLSIPDPRPQYLAQIVNAHRSLLLLRKHDEEKSSGGPQGPVNINIQAYPPATVQGAEPVADDAESATEPPTE